MRRPLRYVLAVAGGCITFALTTAALCPIVCGILDRRATSTELVQNLIGAFRIGLPALASGVFVGAVVRTGSWLWAQCVFLAYLAFLLCVWGSIMLVLYIWRPAVVIMPLALAGGALLGSRLVRRGGDRAS